MSAYVSVYLISNLVDTNSAALNVLSCLVLKNSVRCLIVQAADDNIFSTIDRAPANQLCTLTNGQRQDKTFNAANVCNLSPILFNIFIDDLPLAIGRHGVKVPGLTNPTFFDTFVLELSAYLSIYHWK